MYVHMYICTYVRMYVCMYVCMYTHKYINTYIHIYMYVYIYIYIDIDIYISYICLGDAGARHVQQPQLRLARNSARYMFSSAARELGAVKDEHAQTADEAQRLPQFVCVDGALPYDQPVHLAL